MKRTAVAFGIVLAIALIVLSGCVKDAPEQNSEEFGSVEKAPLAFDYIEGRSCLDVYPTDIQPSDVKFRDKFGVISMPPTNEQESNPFFATGVKIKGVEPTSSAETTRIALFCDENPDFIRFKGEVINAEESWTFENQQHIAIYVVPIELVANRLWEDVEVELYSDDQPPPPGF